MAVDSKTDRISISDVVALRERRERQGFAVPPLHSKPAIPSPMLRDRHSQNDSQQHRAVILERATQNSEHYEQQKMLDGERRAWFQYPKSQEQYAEWILMTPDMASDLLKSQMLHDGTSTNRRLSVNQLEAYKRDMMKDQWIPTQEAIGINTSGVLFDGQHRLTAIVENGKSVVLWVAWNVLPEGKFVVDSGKRRSIGDKLSLIIDKNISIRTAGIVKALMRGNAKSHTTFTDTEVAEFALKWEGLLDWLQTNLKKARAEVHAAVGKAYLWYGEEAVAPFCERFSSVMFQNEGDPAKALYVALQRGGQGGMTQTGVTYAKTLSALDAEIRGVSMTRLYRKEEDLFEWEPGWNVPAKAGRKG